MLSTVHMMWVWATVTCLIRLSALLSCSKGWITLKKYSMSVVMKYSPNKLTVPSLMLCWSVVNVRKRKKSFARCILHFASRQATQTFRQSIDQTKLRWERTSDDEANGICNLQVCWLKQVFASYHQFLPMQHAQRRFFPQILIRHFSKWLQQN